MKIRRYIANNTQEAILKVKMDLGNEAIILNTKKVKKKGILNIFSKPMVEVLAAVDEYASSKEIREAKGTYDNNRILKTGGNRSIDSGNDKITSLENKMGELESILKKIYGEVVSDSNPEDTLNTGSKSKGLSGILEVFYNNLLKNDVDEELAKQIINSVIQKVGENPGVNDAASALYYMITRIMGKPQPLKFNDNGKPAVVVFVGPTGVGKTTTLAKIAANYLLNEKKSVAFITADTYRIAAVDQLKTYAEILGLPISVIYSPDELKSAIKEYSDKDLILIDTAGRSHRNNQQFEELKTLIEISQADEVYLVISAATSLKNCREILNNYNFLGDYKLIFTKLDEVASAGIVLNIKSITQGDLSYVTTGQNVPDDIETVNVDKIVKSLLGSIN